MRILLPILVILTHWGAFSQNGLYFPPLAGNDWAEVTPQSLGWKTDELPELQSFLENSGTRAFLVLQDGKIALEYYFNGHDASKPWYWASAGKSLTSILVAFAEEQGKLKLTDASHLYLGDGWTSCTETQEDNISIWNHITMTTGLDDKLCFDCLDPDSLQCIADPGTRWAYHNSPYTLLDGVIEGATGRNLNLYFKDVLGDEIGMTGAFIKSGNNNVFYSTGRNAARFGLFVLAEGYWNGKEILTNREYLTKMKNSSQTINPSYGYLWWLNGKGKVMLPGLQLPLNRDLNRNAPKDMFAALGKNDQKIYIIPSQNMVVVRLGDLGTGTDTPVPIIYDEALWERLSSIFNIQTSTEEIEDIDTSKQLCHMEGGKLVVNENLLAKSLKIFDGRGQLIGSCTSCSSLALPSGYRGLLLVSMMDEANKKYSEKYIIH